MSYHVIKAIFIKQYKDTLKNISIPVSYTHLFKIIKQTIYTLYSI